MTAEPVACHANPSGFMSEQVYPLKKDGSTEKSKEWTANVTEKDNYVEFEHNDPRNPVNFSYTKKWAITLVGVAFTGLSAATSSAYSYGYDTMIAELGCTRMEATLGLSMFTIGFAIVPLVSSPFSEEFGRRPVYLVSAFIFLMSQIMIALAPNVAVVIVGRFLNGFAGSTAATLVGGTIADIWEPAQRGLPMSIYSLLAMFGTSVGPVVGGWIDMNPNMHWRWIFWMGAIFSGTYLIVALFFTQETRSSIILANVAKQRRKETGDETLRSRSEVDSQSFWMMLKASSTRPLYMLFTEPVVFAFSLWIGFAWGLVYALIDSIGSVFKSVYAFNTGETGSIFTSLCIGCLLGCALNYYQETLYTRNFATRGPEARLYVAMLAAVLFPAGMFIYAWTAFPYVPWIAPAIGLTVFMTSCYVIYQTVFVYLADCYGKWASSALAGQSLLRNLLGAAFPLFTEQMYDRLTYEWSNTLFAFIAVAMIPIPYALFFYGDKIRARSKISQEITAKDTD
ncbi:MFS general substrate transporter [Coniophora puteana RWD-64-598 SS2]|uniref:MFS general substrate transporter n=1 Tax=Coniophora puteana (strain RWD-64-598) TaxID=741705 RepID=A0A5M3MCN6_CONPW|nr:MFS general substrate transporter [Coniophora puteana RWD-64-598 SS2]EIW77022.1 MFS general substrate transporter [Coniophora puteana RWD-64-598 SS2]